MKAITILQPLAQLVVAGHKDIDLRDWQTEHRGELAIHAAKTDTAYLQNMAARQPIFDLLIEEGFPKWTALPRGAVIGQVILTDIQPIETYMHMLNREQRRVLYASQGHMRHWYGKYVWCFDHATIYAKPIRTQGKQGIWEWEKDAQETIEPEADAEFTS